MLEVDHGTTSEGTFSVEVRPSREGRPSSDSICLQLRYEGRGVDYGCGKAPDARTPFGLLVSDPLTGGSREGVVYGLVAGGIATVDVLLPDGDHREAATEEKHGLPGRFFAVVVPRLLRVEVIGRDRSGKEVARIGSLAPATKSPHSHAEAVEQGDPAGFAPTVPTPGEFFFQGKRISERRATRLGLACVQGRDAFVCYRSSQEAEASRRARQGK